MSYSHEKRKKNIKEGVARPGKKANPHYKEVNNKYEK